MPKERFSAGTHNVGFIFGLWVEHPHYFTCCFSWVHYPFSRHWVLHFLLNRAHFSQFTTIFIYPNSSSFYALSYFTLYNGSRLNGTATSGLEGRVPQLQKASLAASKSLLFSFVFDTSQAISVNFF